MRIELKNIFNSPNFLSRNYLGGTRVVLRRSDYPRDSFKVEGNSN